MRLRDFILKELREKGWSKSELARQYGAVKENEMLNRSVTDADVEAIHPNDIDASKYVSAIRRLLENPVASQYETVSYLVSALGYKIVFVRRDSPDVIEL